MLTLLISFQLVPNLNPLTTTRLRIDVVDANDNCPVFGDPERSLIDRTSLSLDLRGNQLNVSDQDNSNNSVIQYFTGEILFLGQNSEP